MSEKEPTATKAYHSEPNRRDFLKTGAVFAGTAILGHAFNTAFASAAGENPQDLKDVQNFYGRNKENEYETEKTCHHGTSRIDGNQPDNHGRSQTSSR